ncbi:MAG: hypothetical protein QM809_02210 [Gordonia sp. (in: high G+C Gram-positive bacteria)]|uniref:hypothetical protein n=1 Tax=Gordonia sp. (in: high G+C Gram-positive bacteria) TaxID=84139 RepID=UPI0039E711C2
MTTAVTPDEATREIGEAWAKALNSLDSFYDLCAPGCKVWHSNDDQWISVETAIENVHKRTPGDTPPTFEARGVTYTEKGFFNECYVEVELMGNPMKLHLIQLVEVEDGKAVSVKEYIGPEMPVG